MSDPINDLRQQIEKLTVQFDALTEQLHERNSVADAIFQEIQTLTDNFEALGETIEHHYRYQSEVMSHLGEKFGVVQPSIYNDLEDELYLQAREAVLFAGAASTSYLQRKLGVGYARAAHLIDMLEEKGVIGPAKGARPRRILISE